MIAAVISQLTATIQRSVHVFERWDRMIDVVQQHGRAAPSMDQPGVVVPGDIGKEM